MEFNSKFNIRNKVWVPEDGVPKEATIGKIIIELTDSIGIPGEEAFSNYMPQNSYTEKYMCVETGIGSGKVFELGRNIFESKEDCQKEIDSLIKTRNLSFGELLKRAAERS